MYKLIKTQDKSNPFDYTDIEFTVDTGSLPQLLEAYTCFLRACGFSFHGELEIVDNDWESEESNNETK